MSDKVWIQIRGGSGWGCECMAKTLPLIEADMLAQGLIKYSLDVYQWAYNPGRVSKSAGTHDLGGVIDVGQHTLAQRKVWAKWGVMMFPRTRQFGWYTGDHGHGVWHGCPHQVSYTDWQVRSGLAGGDGLGSSATLRGKNWRYFEKPTMTWQQAIAKNRTPTVSASGAQSDAKSPSTNTSDWSNMATKEEIEAVVRKVVREELAKPMAGPWLATWGGVKAMDKIQAVAERAAKAAR